jgi:hypothetical protein
MARSAKGSTDFGGHQISSPEPESAPSPKLGADSRCIASVSVSPIHKRFGCRIEDTQTHPASDRRPGISDKPLHWRTATEISARFSKTSGEAPLTLQLVVC